MAKTRLQKEQSVKNITEKLSRSRSVVFADFRGLTMNQLSALRNKLKEVGAEFNVTKNTLLSRAFKNSHPQFQVPSPKLFEGPTATLFSFEDQISPIKLLVQTLTDANIGPLTGSTSLTTSTLRIKGGFLDAQFLDSLALTYLASLPSKEELRAKIVGSISFPLYGMVGVLQANLRNLIFALRFVADKRQAKHEAGP